MAGSVQRQKVYVQVTDWRLFGEGIASGLDYARKPRESPPNNSALCSHPRPGPVDNALSVEWVRRIACSGTGFSSATCRGRCLPSIRRSEGLRPTALKPGRAQGDGLPCCV